MIFYLLALCVDEQFGLYNSSCPSSISFAFVLSKISKEKKLHVNQLLQKKELLRLSNDMDSVVTSFHLRREHLHLFGPHHFGCPACGKSSHFAASK